MEIEPVSEVLEQPATLWHEQEWLAIPRIKRNKLPFRKRPNEARAALVHHAGAEREGAVHDGKTIALGQDVPIGKKASVSFDVRLGKGIRQNLRGPARLLC